MEYIGIYESPIGILTVRADKSSVTGIIPSDYYGKINDNGIIKAAIRELDEYFGGKRYNFDIPVNPRGTPFQLAVWEKTASIPYGKTTTYSEIAALLGDKNLSRAVGNALNRNPILILIPCHRVVGKNGKLTGFAAGLSAKECLLSLENANFKG
jgi:O-6-methylguanine DNA methyltransferase